MPESIYVATERPDVYLRQLAPQDTEQLFALIDRNREHLSQFGDETGAKYPDERSVLLSITHNTMPDKLRFGVWMNGQLAGSANLTPYRGFLNGEIGYWIGQQYTGCGLATIATKALARYAFESLDWGCVFAGVHKDNEASKNVLHRAGFKFESMDGDILIVILRTIKLLGSP